MKLLSLILTSLAIIAYVQGSYKITSLTVWPLNSFTDFNLTGIKNPLLGGIQEEITITHGTIKFTFKEEVYQKPYLHYELKCKTVTPMDIINQSPLSCTLTFLSFDKNYEKIQMEILIINKKGEDFSKENLLKLLSEERFCYLNNLDDPFLGLRVKDEEEEEELNFSFNLKTGQFYQNPENSVSIKPEKKKSKKKEKGGLSGSSSLLPHQSKGRGRKDEKIVTEEMQIIQNIESIPNTFQVYSYNNALLFKMGDTQKTYNLNPSHCVLKFIEFVKAEHMSSCTNTFNFNFYAFEDPVILQPTKTVELLQGGRIKNIQYQKFIEVIDNNKVEVEVEFKYVSFEEEVTASGKRLTLRIENEEKIIKKYFFIFNKKNKKCLNLIKSKFYASVPCTDKAVIVKNINSELTDDNYLIEKCRNKLVIRPLHGAKNKAKIFLQDIYLESNDYDNSNFLTFIGRQENNYFLKIQTHNSLPQKCEVLLNEFKHKLEQKLPCWPLYFKRVDIFVDRDKLGGKPIKSFDKYGHVGILEDRKLNIIFDEDNSANSKKEYERVLDFKFFRDYVEFEFPGDKFVRFWVSVRHACLSDITNKINNRIGCPSGNDNKFYMSKDKQFYPFTINELNSPKQFMSWSGNNYNFSKLIINQNIIQLDPLELKIQTPIVSSPRCSKKFQRLLMLNPEESDKLVFWGYSQEFNKKEKDFSNKYSLEKIMFFEKGDLDSLLGRGYVFKHVFEKNFKEEDSFSYYLAEFYREEGDEIEILRCWFVLSLKFETFVEKIIGKECNTSNQFVYYNASDLPAGLIAIDTNYLNAIDLKTGATYNILGIDYKEESNEFAVLHIKYLSFENYAKAVKHENTKIIETKKFKMRTNCSQSLANIQKQVQSNLYISQENTFRYFDKEDRVTRIMSLQADSKFKIISKNKEETYYYASKFELIIISKDNKVAIGELVFLYISSKDDRVLKKTVILPLAIYQDPTILKEKWDFGLKCLTHGSISYITEDEVGKGWLSTRFDKNDNKYLFENESQITPTPDIKLLRSKAGDVLVAISGDQPVHYKLLGGDSYCKHLIAEFPYKFSEKCLKNNKMSVISLSDEPELLGQENHYTLVIKKQGGHQKATTKTNPGVTFEDTKYSNDIHINTMAFTRNPIVNIKPVLVNSSAKAKAEAEIGINVNLEIHHNYHETRLVEKFNLSKVRLTLFRQDFLHADVLVVTYFDEEIGKDREMRFNTRAFKHCLNEPFKDIQVNSPNTK
jgi:hypothetical protein